MNKIHYQLSSRLDKVLSEAQKTAARWGNLTRAEAVKMAMNSQVKYGRAGYRSYDSANHYNAEGDLCAENLNGYNATSIQDIRPRYFDYSGYYADNFQNELVNSYVVKIKAGKKGVFICPAISYSDCDIATIYFSHGQFAPNDTNSVEYDAAMMDAARIADGIAESEAEKSREADAQFQAEDQAEQLADTIKDARETARGLIAAIKAQRKAGIDLGGAICDALTDKLREYRREIIKARERRDALKDNYWLSVEGY